MSDDVWTLERAVRAECEQISGGKISDSEWENQNGFRALINVLERELARLQRQVDSTTKAVGECQLMLWPLK